MDVNNQAQVIDYDKEPIKIEDHNSLFAFLFQICLIPIMVYTYIYNPGNASADSLFRNFIIIIPLSMLPFIKTYIDAQGKRKIILFNNSIQFLHNNHIIEEICLTDISEIRKTFYDTYHKSQTLNPLGIFFAYAFLLFIVISQKAYFLLFVIPSVHIFLLFAKLALHKLKDKHYKYRFFDAILIYSGDRFINILPTTTKEYEQVKNYFLNKSFGDIQKKKVYYEFSHSFENLTKGK